MSVAFGKNLKYYRVTVGMSMQALSKVTGIGRSSINNYERGVAEPSFENLCKLARALGVDITDLVRQETPVLAENPSLRLISEDETILVDLFREADPVYRTVAMDILRSHKKENK